MNSFRVISNVKLIASNVHTKKTTSISAHGFRLLPLYTQKSWDMSQKSLFCNSTELNVIFY